jgi:hypothetical protein
MFIQLRSKRLGTILVIVMAAINLITGQPAGAEKAQAFAYLVYSKGIIEQYRVTAGGSFVPLEPLNLKVGISPTRMVIGSNGQYAYIAERAGKLHVLAIETNGCLSPVDEVQLPPQKFATGILIGPSGKHLYLSLAEKVDQGESEMVAFSIESDGKLIRLDGGSIITGQSTLALAANPSVPCIYAGDNADGSISAYRLNADGTLLQFGPPTLPGTGDAGDMAMTSDNKFLYVTNARAHSITQFRVGGDGRTSRLSESSFESQLGGQGHSAEIALTAASDVVLVVYPAGSTLCKFKMVDGKLPSTPQFYVVTRNNRLLAFAELEALAEATPSVQSAVADNKAEQEIDEARGRAKQSLCATPGSIASGPDGILYLFSSAGVLRFKVDKDGTLKDLGSAVRWKDKWDIVSDNESMGKPSFEGVLLPARHGITIVTR